MTKIRFYIFILVSLILMPLHAADLVWDFKTDTQGWYDLGEGRDARVSWEDGRLKMAYEKRTTPEQGPQVWFPAMEITTPINADEHAYFEMNYQADWPNNQIGYILLMFGKAEENKFVYSYVPFDPAENFISIDIKAHLQPWDNTVPYEGEFTYLRIELPHTSSPGGNPGSAWFNGSCTWVDKIVLSDSQHPSVIYEEKSAAWDFENNISDTKSKYTFSAIGNPALEEASAKTGLKGLSLNGESNIVLLSEDDLFTYDNFSFAAWIKPVGNGQNDPLVSAQLLSINGDNFTIANREGKLYFKRDRSWDEIMTLNQDTWQHVSFVAQRNTLSCYLNGKKVKELRSVPASARRGSNASLIIGEGGFKSSMDDLLICNYALSDKEIYEMGKLPLSFSNIWDFKDDLQGWFTDVGTRDIDLTHENGALVMNYVNNNVPGSDGRLWFAQIKTETTFDAKNYPYFNIYYETVGWPSTAMSKGLLEFTRKDGAIAYSYFDIDPTQNFVSVDIAATDPAWGGKYEGEIVRIALELPHNGSALQGTDWFGNSTRVTKIELAKKPLSVSDDWNSVLDDAAITKSGMEKLNRSDYQYIPIGLGGTALRVDPWGLAGTNAPNASVGGAHIHRPYYGYEYWWDKKGHRFNPFVINGGYGDDLKPGTITSFDQKMDIKTGIMETNLGLNVGGVEFTSKRTTFVNPDGILVIKVEDNGAPSPFKLDLSVRTEVRIYNNPAGTHYEGPHEPWSGTYTQRSQETTYGAALVATRPSETLTCDAALAVAVEQPAGATVTYDNQGDHVYVSSTGGEGAVTFYISPQSNFNPTTPNSIHDHAWNWAYEAKNKGFDALKQETNTWWAEYMNKSKVSVPDETVGKLYAQSLYYHGIYFGKTAIPPGCNSTDIESFGGAVCPEYDLVMSQLALAYTGHLDESKNIADWVHGVLPKTKEQALGICHFDVCRAYDGGAIYTTLMGFDGTHTWQAVPEIEAWGVLQNYPGANAAFMALTYLDYSNDESFREKAHDVLYNTTYVAVADLIDDGNGNFISKEPITRNTVQQAATRMSLEECIKRGIADTDWMKYKNKVLIPETTLFGEKLIAGGVGSTAEEGVGDATWLYPFWWYNVLDKTDERMLPSYINSAKSKTGDYVFNNGCMSVNAAKLGLGNDALGWLKNYESTDILYDETCFTEARGNLEYTPEIGAHGSYICGLTQMLLDPDNEQQVDIFQAVPDAWEYEAIGFEGLMTKGGLVFTANRDMNNVTVIVKNNSTNQIQRKLRIRIPRLLETKENSNMENGYIVVPLNIAAGATETFTYTLQYEVPSSIAEDKDEEKSNKFIMYPNPNIDRTLYFTNGEEISDIHIYSISGKAAARLKGGLNSYDIGMLSAGVYVVTLKTKSNEYVSRKLIVKN